MLVITGQPPLPSFGKRALQESSCTGINTVGMFRHCTRYNSLVSHSDQVEIKLINALMQACQTPPGPTHLSIPVDILRSSASDRVPSTDFTALLRQKPSLVDLYAVQELKAQLECATKPVFLIGGGCGEAIEAILKLAEISNAMFVTTPDGKGLVSPRHLSYRGVFGFAGHRSADDLLRGNPDLILAFGTGLNEWTSGAWCDSLLNDRLVHIDCSEDHLRRSPMARLHVRGRIRSVCEELIKRLSRTGKASDQDSTNDVIALRNPDAMLQEPDKFHSNASPIKPQRLMRELSRRCPPNTRFVADAGNSTAWAVHYLQPNDRRVTRGVNGVRLVSDGERRAGTGNWLRTTMDFAPMGWAIGAAIGVARANPNCPVVCVTGDGSYLMNGQEITVAAAEQLCVVFVVLNDSALGMVKHGQRLAGAEPIGFELPQVDYRMLAQAMGIPGHIIGSPEDFDQLDFEAILSRKGPTMLDVRIDGEEVPPMKVRMKTLGTVK